MATQESHFTESTTEYWQEIISTRFPQTPPYKYRYPASLPNFQTLILPIRQLPNNSSEAVASLIINQASIPVVEQLGSFLGDSLQEFTSADVLVGLPTLGLTVANVVAKSLGHTRYVPLGYSRKFWYTDELSTTVTSITSPNHAKPIFLDPNQLALLRGKRVVIIDDAVSSGKTLRAVWDFLEGELIGAEILAAGVLMVQGQRWRSVIGEGRKVRGVFESPLLKRVDGGWDVRE